MWVLGPVGFFFGFGDKPSTWTGDISSSQVAEVKTGDKEISIQIAQVHTSGPGELESLRVQQMLPHPWWTLVSEGSTLGNTVFVTFIIIDSTNKMAIIPSMKMITYPT